MSKELSILVKVISQVKAGFADAYAGVKGFVSKISSVAGGIWDGVKKVAGWLVGIGAVIVGGLTLAIRESIKVQDEMDKLNNVLETTAANAGFTAQSLAKQRQELQAIIPVAEEAAIALQTMFLKAGGTAASDMIRNFELAAQGLAKINNIDIISAGADIAGAMFSATKAMKFFNANLIALDANERLLVERAVKTNDALSIQELLFKKLAPAIQMGIDSGIGFDATLAKVTIGFKKLLAVVGDRAIKALGLEDFFSTLARDLNSLSGNSNFIKWVDKNLKALIPFKTFIEGIMEIAKGNIDIGEAKIHEGIAGITTVIKDAFLWGAGIIKDAILEVLPAVSRTIVRSLLGKQDTAEEIAQWLKTTKDLAVFEKTKAKMYQEREAQYTAAGKKMPFMTNAITDKEVSARINKEKYAEQTKISEAAFNQRKFARETLPLIRFNPQLVQDFPSVFSPKTNAKNAEELLTSINNRLDTSPTGDPKGVQSLTAK